jgi:tetratricopeptide (TPR) repeat protein
MLAQSQAAAKAGRTDDAADLQNRAAALTKIIAERHAGHWGRRAESLLAATAAAAPTGDVALLIKAAESFYQQGNVDRALEVYARAFENARETNDVDTAMRIGLTAAAIEQSTQRAEAAANRLLALAAAFPTHANAARVHLAGALVDFQRPGQENRPERTALFSQRLDEHVARFPASETVKSAYLWIGQLRMTEKNWPAAIAALEKSEPSSANGLDALVKSWEAVLTERKGAGQPLPIMEMERSLGVFAPGLLGMLEDSTSPTARDAAWQAARLWLRYADDRYAQAASVLTQLADTAPNPAEQVRAEAWLVVADVGLGRYDAALARAQKLTMAVESGGAEIVARLDELTQQRPAASQRQIAAVTLQMAERTRLGSPVNPKAEARALSLVGRSNDARQLWDKLTAAKPKDVDLAEEYAAFLTGQTDRASAEAAAAKWRIVERASKESTPRWYRARLGLAKSYLQLGDKARAVQLLDITEALHPDLGGEALRREFENVRAAVK